MSDCKPTASGQRRWKLDHINAECPFCEYENWIDDDDLDFDELWHMVPFIWTCGSCHKDFYVEVDDDDR